MNPVHISILSVLMINVALGMFVFFTHPRRAPNQHFLVLSLVIAAWMACIENILLAPDATLAAFWIRQSSAVSVLVPTAFDFLRRSISGRSTRWGSILRQGRPMLALSALIMLLCQTDIYLRTALVAGNPSVQPAPEAVYGPGLYVFLLYHLAVWIVLIHRFWRDMREAHGLRRAELQFTLLGWTSGIFVCAFFALLLPLVTGSSQPARFAPLGALFFDASIAYGIATRRIMDVAEVLRRFAAYALLTAYLVLLYAAVWAASHLVLRGMAVAGFSFAHLIAALAVAFSMAPAHGHLQRFANRLFINVQPLDVSGTMQNANRILHSIATLDELLSRFAESIAEAVGTDRVTILLREQHHYEQQYPLADDHPRFRIPESDPLLEALRKKPEPLVAETVQRMRPTAELTGAARRLAELRAATAVGIVSKRGLDGVMLLGPRLSGRIYGAMEQDTLQILCNQLAVALENAKLYTQVQDGKIYNDILLDNLVSGVIAVNAEGLVTVFNREAQRITRMDPTLVLNQPMNTLPEALAFVFRSTFQRGYGLRDQELSLGHAAGEETPIRAGSSIFRSHQGRVMGVLLVFNDLTTLKKLELQVRRTDRLASLGTLAAGMAHEIKNPLVTIKTFTQLLPERYEDEDFRDTFSSLIGQEVKRIDSIVNQLLKFSRPAKPDLVPTHLHEVLNNSTNLISQQLRQKGIELVLTYEAANDMVQADADQLNQAFINFLLNATEAMSGRGQLFVGTELIPTEPYALDSWQQDAGEGRIRVTIRDTGDGIAPDLLGRIFDPFFTTKSHGTGLGLSVAHGIIQEHSGAIDVESELGKGTAFFIAFPLLHKEAAV